MKKLAVLFPLLAWLGCAPDAPVPAPAETAAARRDAVVTAFAANSLIIPMDTTSQDNGTLRAFGLVDTLLRANVPVHRIALTGKAAGATDFSATVRNRETNTLLGSVSYRGGPFVVSAADVTASVLTTVDTYLASDTVTVVHVATAAFNADVQRSLFAAPRIAVLRDGNEAIAYAYLNAANIRDSAGNAWSNASPGALTLAGVAGVSGGAFDGTLFTGGQPAWDQLTSMHYDPPAADEVVREVRGWLNAGPSTHAFMQCAAITTFENNTNGRFLTTAGMVDDGARPTPLTVLQPVSLFAQFDGNLLSDTGSTDSLGLAATSTLYANSSVLVAQTGATLGSKMMWLTGYLDGNTSKGKVSYLTGHNYSTTVPISANDATNGVRFFLDSLYETPSVFSVNLPTPSLTKSAPARTNALNYTFTLSYANAGPGTAYNVTLTDVLPAGTTFVSATGGGTNVAGTVTWTLGTLVSGASGSVTVTVTSAEGTFANTARLNYFVGLTAKSVTSNSTSTIVDRTAPDTTLTATPAAVTNVNSGSFSFTATEAGSTFQCSLDGAAFSACTTPLAFAGLADGSHSFQVRATDLTGNTDPTPASFSWTIDTVAPDTSFTSTPPASSNSSSANFAFTSNEAGATFQCSLDGAAFTACTSPRALVGLGDGSHTFQVRATDAAGNTDPTPASYTWTVDTTPPDTVITAGPPALSNSASASFTFNATEAGSTLQCSLDGAPFVACTSPLTLSGLADGAHTLRVRAMDAVGNLDPTPASYTWTVDTTPPDTTLTSTPPNPSNSASATFAFSTADASATFQCSLDGAAFTACASPRTVTSLADGSHTFAVRAVDAAGNADPTPASYTWTVDTTPPDTSFTSTPPSFSNSSSANFAFTSTEAGSTFQCSLDGAAFTACTSPRSLTGLSDGSHTLRVRATDTVGNVDPTPASYTWTVDTTPPDTTITASPPAASNSANATFAFTATEAGATFECSLDGAAFSACTTPRALSGLGDGAHTFRVRATDTAGNVDPTPASYAWTIDTTPPDTSFTSTPPALTSSTTATFAFTSEPGALFQCSLDGAAFTSCTSPLALSGLADGSHTLQVRAVDALGNADPTPASFTWTVDTTPPDTTIVSGPPAVTNATTATLAFTSSEAGSTFECSLDGAAFSACPSPTTTPTLTEGSHTFAVRARDAAGNLDPTPATRTWTVDTTPPDTTIASGPSGSSSSSTATFGFTATEAGSTFQCSLDGAAFAACPASATFSGLAEGAHSLSVRAIDPAGNVDPTPATRSWTVDLTPPDTTITQAPSGTINTSTATIAFTSNEAGATFECSLDGAAFSACTSPDALSALNDGPHTFSVRAVDAAGTRDPSPATVSFTVDASEPDTVIATGPSGSVASTTADFTFTSTKPNSTFECSLDGATFASCTASSSFTSLSDGSHTLQVRARDAGGNVDPSPASRMWTVDTRTPDTTIVSKPPTVSRFASADFEFDADEPNVTFECSLDGAVFTTCTRQQTFSNLADGLHVLLVRAVDAAGNTDATPALATWTVDTRPPPTPVILEPVADATTGALPRFGGTAEPNTTVTVKVDGTAVCSGTTDAAGRWTCTPTMPLSSGMHGATATATDAGGNESQPSPTRAFTVDASKPDTVITSGPAAVVKVRDASFTVVSDQASATFECSLDGAAFMSCTSSPSFQNLADGTHTLQVRAVAGGVADPTPATSTWLVDTMAPAAPVITSPSANATTSATPTFAGTAEAGSTVTVSVDGAVVCTAIADASGAFSCAAPAALPNGMHTVTATAKDAAGNVSPPSTGVPFTVDGSLLDTAIIAGPSGTVRSTTADFAFSSTVLGATYECSLDGAAFTACSTPTSFTNLSDGQHTLEVRAVNGGNTDTTPASRTWTIDSTAPNAPVVTAPADGTTIYTRTPLYQGTAEPGSTVRVSVDDQVVCTAVTASDGTWSCTGTTPLASGAHRVSAMATDAAGNTSPASNTNRFTVDIPDVMVSITSPTDGTLTNDSTPTITGTATPNSTVTVYVDGMAVGSATADAQGHWTFRPTTALTDGTHTITASADFMSLMSPMSNAVKVTVDTKPPVIQVDVQQMDSSTPPTLVFGSDEPVTYQCSVDGGEFKPCSSPFDTTPFGDGHHTIVVRATDSAGNVTESTRTWDVTAPLVEKKPDLYIRGGGCGCGVTENSSLAVLALGLLALFSRRRGRALRRGLSAPALALLTVVAGTSARAQVAGFDIERIDWNPGASSSLVNPTGDVLERGRWRVSLLGHYEHDPLLLYRSDTGARVGSIIGSRVSAHVLAAWAPVEWLEVGLQLPIVLFQRGDALGEWGVGNVTSTALGTPYLQGRFALLKQKNKSPIDLAVQLGLGLPLGSAAAYSQVSPISVTPRLSVGRDFAPWLRLGVELGFVVRGGSASSGLAITQQGTGSSFSWAANVLARPSEAGEALRKLRGELTVRGLVGLDKTVSDTELLLGARYPLGDWFEVFALGGPGFGAMPGTPAFRVMAGVALAPPVEPPKPPAPVCTESTPNEVLVRDCAQLDADGDGIVNGVDACLRVAGVTAYKGCPIPDTDDDGLTDDVDQCPKEKGLKEKQGCPVRDEDKDGIEDALDACPKEAGLPERNGCPVRDQDKDGVEDEADACPTEAGPVERKGCPIRDGDEDGVEDAIDNCPTVKGSVTNAGCPEKQRQLVVITSEKLIIKEKVFFATAKSVVLPRSFALLDNVAEVLTAHKEVELVRIEGHTDSQGKREMNLKLSQARADAVKAYLVKKGVSPERLHAVGFGPDQPTAPNDTPAGREQNRRVEFNFEAVKH
ncbi:MAG: Ig-like domain-containing protein [Myxococcaceae bacterium]